jgi:hypothetical protein
MNITRDEFDLWRKDPVTRWIMAGIANAKAQEKAEWDRLSWGNGEADQGKLTVLKTRSDALGELSDNDYEIWSMWNGEEVQND